jgi:hypothetical protein
MSSQLQLDVFHTLGAQRIARVRLATALRKNAWLPGVIVGLIVGFLSREIVLFIFVGGGAWFATYFYADRFLLAQDLLLFSSPGMSKRELFDRHFAAEVERQVGLRMTEPQAIVATADQSLEVRREAFKRELDLQLEKEFRRFDWQYFVREVVRQSK